MDRITPFLWFDNTAEEAADLYVSIFKNSKVTKVRRWGEGGPAPAGTVMAVDFQLDGRNYIAFNGGPHYKFNASMSMYVNCKDQVEVDEIWNKLVADGGEPVRCGWLKDKFGLSWQIIPEILGELLQSGDSGKAKRATQAMMKMIKIDVAELERAAKG